MDLQAALALIAATALLVAIPGVVSRLWWKFVSGALRARLGSFDQAARSSGIGSMGWARVCQPSTLRMLIWPEA